MSDLIGPFTTKYAGKCNICRHPYDVGERIQQDPAKPTWYSEKAQKEQKNWAHVSCVEAGRRQFDDEPERTVKPYSFAPNGTNPVKVDGDIRGLLMAFRHAIDLYLGEDKKDTAPDYEDALADEIPF